MRREDVHTLDDPTRLRAELAALLEAKSPREASRYSLLLAAHGLELAGIEADEAMRECFAVCRRWQAGGAKLQEARQAAFRMHRLAREENDPLRRTALRMMGQAAATPHVKGHALAAGDYAVKLVRLLCPGDEARVRAERKWQIELMRRL